MRDTSSSESTSLASRWSWRSHLVRVSRSFSGLVASTRRSGWSSFWKWSRSGVSGVRSSCEAMERNSSRRAIARRASLYSRALSKAKAMRWARSRAISRSSAM